MFKTTFSLDRESFRYLYNIALLKLDIGEGVYNLNQILRLTIKFMINNEKIDLKKFEIQSIKKTDGNKYIMFLSEENEVKIYFDNLAAKLFELHKFEVKYNQIIKSSIIHYHNYLLNDKKNRFVKN